MTASLAQLGFNLGGCTELAPLFRPARPAVPPPAKRALRWNGKRHSYRPAGETINPRNYAVAEIETEARSVAESFVVAHHYAHSTPPIRWSFGLFYGPLLVGVALFTIPQRDEVLTNWFPGDVDESTELGRLVLLDWVPGMAESWFLSRVFRKLRKRVRGVVSFSDPVPRYTRDGREVMPGHVGLIYQALGAVYLQRGRADWQDLFLDDATTFARRSLTKLLAGDKGRRYAEKQLRAHGAPPLGDEDPRAYVDTWLPRISRRVWHPGKHRYAFAFDAAEQRRLERLSQQLAGPTWTRPLPYPKRLEVL
jgi:hypothetical protein